MVEPSARRQQLKEGGSETLMKPHLLDMVSRSHTKKTESEEESWMAGAAEHARLIPTGDCWCGCGEQVALGAFFARGHDKVAEAALLAARYAGSVAQMLSEHGYDAGRSVTDDAVKSGIWERCPRKGCNYAGTPSSVRSHQIRTSH